MAAAQQASWCSQKLVRMLMELVLEKEMLMVRIGGCNEEQAIPEGGVKNEIVSIVKREGLPIGASGCCFILPMNKPSHHLLVWHCMQT